MKFQLLYLVNNVTGNSTAIPSHFRVITQHISFDWIVPVEIITCSNVHWWSCTNGDVVASPVKLHRLSVPGILDVPLLISKPEMHCAWHPNDSSSSSPSLHRPRQPKTQFRLDAQLWKMPSPAGKGPFAEVKQNNQPFWCLRPKAYSLQHGTVARMRESRADQEVYHA